jgi:uncharacterized membrane protein YhaH (DUF805 family)
MRSSHSLADIEDHPWSAIRKNWTILTQVAAGVMAVVATIIAPPPTPVGTLGIRPFASFVVAILAGIFILALRRFRKQEHSLFWAALAAILLLLTVVDYFWYFNLIDTRTETWHERTIVCGTELRPEIQNKYGSTIRKSRVRQLLDDAAGDPQLIWTDQSIRASKDILCVSYLVIVPLIGGCIMAASQIPTCRTRPRSHTKPAKANKKKTSTH